MSTCANCGAELKSGVFSSNDLLSDDDIQLINTAYNKKLTTGCVKCAQPMADGALFRLGERLRSLRREAEALLDAIPLASLSLPFGWKFKTLELVTAQTVSGTGLFSDVTSAFTDLFGTQSGAYNNKLRAAENLCRASLRAQAYHLGANAILGVDVDYAEVGGQRAMLMVCMAGTAVHVENEEMLGEGFASRMEELRDRSTQVRALAEIAGRYGVS